VVTQTAVIGAVAHFYGISIKRLIGASRCQGVARPRAIAMYLCRHLTRSSYPEIGAAFGQRHHTTAITAVRRVESAIDGSPPPGMDPDVVAHVEVLRAQLIESVRRGAVRSGVAP
jgi:chromosomal replication initiator protein